MIYRFGSFSLDSGRLELSNGDTLLTVQPQVFSLLTCLIENRDRVVSKDEVFEIVWDGRIVSDGTLNARLNAARSALGDNGKDQAIIRTFPRKGFRFVAEVTVDGSESPALATPPHSDKPSIAVLPFTNLSNDPEQEYFADGIAEDIITALSRFQWFFVIARNSSFSYKGQAVDLKQIAGELGVQYVLEGSVRKAGKHVRVSAQLVDSITGRNVWVEQYDRDLDDIFAVQDEITEAIAAAVAPSFVSAEEQRIDRKPPESFDAWEYALRGNQRLWRLTKEDIIEAKKLFQLAIDLDPKSSIALSGLSLVCVWEFLLGLIDNPPEALEKAQQAAQQAITADQHDAWAHAMLGFVNIHRREHDAAISAYKRAIEINPNLAFAEGGLGHAYGWLGNYDEAIVHADKAQRLSPYDPARLFWNMGRAAAAFVAGKYEEGVHWSEQLTETFPHFALGWRILATCYAHIDRINDASAAVDKLLRLAPHENIQLVSKAIPVSHSEDQEKFLDGLRKAGLPES